jgi:hypothetical protein
MRCGAVVAENRSCRLVGAIHASGTSVTLRVCCPHIESLFPPQEPRLKTLPVIRMETIYVHPNIFVKRFFQLFLNF